MARTASSEFPGHICPDLQKATGVKSVSFEELLEEGLCFGWSESQRLKGNNVSYLQKFTPRKTIGTTSEYNVRYAKQLIAEDRMTSAGLQALNLPDSVQQHTCQRNYYHLWANGLSQ